MENLENIDIFAASAGFDQGHEDWGHLLYPEDYTEIGELMKDPDSEKIKYIPNLLYRWDPKKDEIERTKNESRLYDEIERHTGLTRGEIDKDIELKNKILDWLKKKPMISRKGITAVI